MNLTVYLESIWQLGDWRPCRTVTQEELSSSGSPSEALITFMFSEEPETQMLGAVNTKCTTGTLELGVGTPEFSFQLCH